MYSTAHPLDPLSADEIRKVRDVLKLAGRLSSSVRFVSVTLDEPEKRSVLQFPDVHAATREAVVVLRDRASRTTCEARISIDGERLVAWREVPHVQPAITVEELVAAEQAVRRDDRWREAMRRRGVTDIDSVTISGWSPGHCGREDDADRGRFLLPLTHVRSHPEDNGGARPVEGLIVRLDLDTMRVVDVTDLGVVPLPSRSGNYTPDAIMDPSNVPHFPDGSRSDLKPLQITQPEGRSFQVDGNEIRWQKWRLRVGFTPREGLVLHLVDYRDSGRWRPILYRASLAEMFVPYGDPGATHRRKHVMDVGEYGIGMNLNSLAVGCDCVGEIHYFDAWVNDSYGRPRKIANAICLHEEDDGVLWKYQDLRTGRTEARRSRRLVLSTMATVGNYQYGYYWHLYQDGAIEHVVKLTGMVSTGAAGDGAGPAHGALVAPGLYGPNHQHFFCVRLDMMVDGLENSVYECDSVVGPDGPDNPFGNAWFVRESLLARESGAQRLAEPRVARYWKIANAGVLNGVGRPVAYRLQPSDAILPLCQPGSPAIRRAAFATRHLWVTAYDRAERFAAGDYPNQHPGGDGLPAYAAADRPLVDTDLVVWHTFGAHHVVRPEDWPVMPVSRAGFRLEPLGFFDGNPALDLPPPDRCVRAPHTGPVEAGNS
jgi:primary-amine oxidase